MKAFKVASRIVKDGKHYGLCVPVGPGVTTMTEAELAALPEVDMSAREIRLTGFMLMELADAHDECAESLGVVE